MRRAAALAAAALLLLASLAARSAVLRRGPAAQRLVPAAMRSAGAGGAGAAGAGERAALVELQEGAARVFRAPGGSLALSWTEGMRQLASEADTPLQRALLGVLGGQSRAYFWELPPASARADPRFEFVLTPAVRPAHTRERANCACRWDCARSNPIRVHSLMFICRALCEAAAEVLLPEGKYGGLSAFKVVARVRFWATNVVCPARAQRVPWCLARG